MDEPFIDHKSSTLTTLDPNVTTQLISRLNSNLSLNQHIHHQTKANKDTYRKANTATINALTILESNPCHIISLVGMNNLDPFLMENIKSQLLDLASDQGPCISV